MNQAPTKKAVPNSLEIGTVPIKEKRGLSPFSAPFSYEQVCFHIILSYQKEITCH